MATRSRDIAPARQKRGTSPSNLPHTAGTAHQSGRPNPSKTTSSADPTAPEKHVPNYLKSTISSGSDVSKQQVKKPVTSHTSQNTTRRRSLDKSPSPSTTQKPHVSPNPGLRSSLFSAKTAPSQKSVPDKNLKAPKDAGKKNLLYARPVHAVKKSTILVKKEGAESSSSTIKEHVTSGPERADNANVPDSPETETKAEDQECSVTEAEDQTTLLDGSNDETKTMVPESENHEPKDIKKIQVETDKDVMTVTVESPKVEHQEVSPGLEAEEPEEKPLIEETSSKQQELEHATNEINSNNTDESVAAKPNEGVEEKEEEAAAVLDKKEEAAIASEAHDLEETEVPQEVVVEKEKQEIRNAAPKQQVAHGKKEHQVSNDVIEETASKLREQRKNKVKALAGAFETVISLQDPQ